MVVRPEASALDGADKRDRGEAALAMGRADHNHVADRESPD